MSLRILALVYGWACSPLLGAENLGKTPSLEMASMVLFADELMTSYPQSLMAETQLLVWLNSASPTDLKKVEAMIPSPWTGTEVGMAGMEFKEHIENTLLIARNAEGELISLIEKGRLEALKDLKSSLTQANKIQEEEQKRLFLIGVFLASGSLDSFQDAYELRELVSTQLSHSQRSDYMMYGRESWLGLWPAISIASYTDTLNDDDSFSLIRTVCARASWYFSDYDEAENYLKHFGYSAPGQTPVIYKSMGAIKAARQPENYLKWLTGLTENGRSFAISGSIEYLMRNDPEVIHDYLPLFSKNGYYGGGDLALEWSKYNPEEAKKWVSSLSKFHGPSKSSVMKTGSDPVKSKISDIIDVKP